MGRSAWLDLEMKEKDLFWGFDHPIETGEIQEKPARVSVVDRLAGMGGQVLVQVIDSLALAPVHLVPRDSALFFGNKFGVGERDIGLLRLCCARSVDGVEADAHRLALKRKKRKNAVVVEGRALNHSFGVEKWADSEDVKRIPVQLLWFNTLSDQWIDKGHWVAVLTRSSVSTLVDDGLRSGHVIYQTINRVVLQESQSAFSDDNPFLLAVGSHKGKLKVWDTSSEPEMASHYEKYMKLVNNSVPTT